MRLVLVLGILILACDARQDATAPLVLHVSTGHQLTDRSSSNGAAAYIRDLLGERAAHHFEWLDSQGRTMRLSLREHSDARLAELCPRVHGASVVGTPEVVGQTCVLQLTGEVSGEELFWALTVGPGMFQVVEEEHSRQEPEYDCSLAMEPEALYDRIVLRSTGATRVHEIHIHAMSVREEWRHIISRRTDVAPMVPTMHDAWFDEMATVRTVAMEPGGPMSLIFNTERGPFADPAMRKALVRALDLDAIARVACRRPECRELGPLRIDPRAEIATPEPAPTLPEEVTIVLAATDWYGVQAGRAIRYQLRARHGIHVRLERCPVTTLGQAMGDGTFDLALAPIQGLPPDPESAFAYWMKTVPRYWNAELAAARRASDFQAMAELVRRDVFVLPLFVNRYFAAIDQHLCGPAPEGTTSWAWLATLGPCPASETP